MSRLNLQDSELRDVTLFGFKIRGDARTLAGDLTLVVNDPRALALDPGGAGRTITLPADANHGEVFLIVNTADAAEVLTIEDAGTNTIATPTQAEAALCINIQGTWHGLVGSSS